ncbi:hypothetical protein [Streptomyces scabiei]|uniref:hypothetical protein n=1 Tax=Streptomyces scabiei TaxID=1930 RepID=UPI0029BF0F70|nr:hypothetical protein [Streptomyces scabiei]MDX3125739.1 hypothetical protein [Streptomyces scabiei]MDX3202317.1 hypothetical protein [Streptomyces scabiei]MDX3223129.1 hypothetical protein [Streptomyces scabiei]
MSRAAALAALIAYNDATDGQADDVESRIAELIAELAGLTGDPDGSLDIARLKAPRPLYRSADSVRMETASALMTHYQEEGDRLSKAANYVHGAVLRAIRARNHASRARNEAKWEALIAERRANSGRLVAACAAYDAAKAAWFRSLADDDEADAAPDPNPLPLPGEDRRDPWDGNPETAPDSVGEEIGL